MQVKHALLYRVVHAHIANEYEEDKFTQKAHTKNYHHLLLVLKSCQTYKVLHDMLKVQVKLMPMLI